MFSLLNLQGCKNEENCEIDLDDDVQVVFGEGVGEVGDDDEDGGGQEGGEDAAGQWAGQLEHNFETQVLVLQFELDYKQRSYSPTCRATLHRNTPLTEYCSNSLGPLYAMDFGKRIISSSFW